MSAINSYQEALYYCLQKLVLVNVSEEDMPTFVPSWDGLYVLIGNKVKEYCEENGETVPVSMPAIVGKCVEILEASDTSADDTDSTE